MRMPPPVGGRSSDGSDISLVFEISEIVYMPLNIGNFQTNDGLKLFLIISTTIELFVLQT